MRKRRFNEGGSTEEADKAEGLRLSADDKVGFFERFRMGNIDDPESEAYKRFGAGRARAARAAAAPAPAPVKEEEAPKKPMVSGRVTLPAVEMEPGSGGYGEPPEPYRAEESKTKAKPKVEKEEITSPGAPGRGKAVGRTAKDDFRFYGTPTGSGRGSMAGRRASDDIQSSSSRRGEIPVDTSIRAPKSSGDMPGELERNVLNTLGAVSGPSLRGAQAVSKGVGEYARAAREGWKEGSRISKEVAESTARGKASRAELKAKREERARKTAEVMEEAKPVLQARRAKPSPRQKSRFDEDMAGTEFKRGGHVSAASRRADGCAVRGKTRGKVY